MREELRGYGSLRVLESNCFCGFPPPFFPSLFFFPFSGVFASFTHLGRCSSTRAGGRMRVAGLADMLRSVCRPVPVRHLALSRLSSHVPRREVHQGSRGNPRGAGASSERLERGNGHRRCRWWLLDISAWARRNNLFVFNLPKRGLWRPRSQIPGRPWRRGMADRYLGTRSVLLFARPAVAADVFVSPLSALCRCCASTTAFKQRGRNATDSSRRPGGDKRSRRRRQEGSTHHGWTAARLQRNMLRRPTSVFSQCSRCACASAGLHPGMVDGAESRGIR